MTREQEPVAWLTILILASLRSPFLPLYAVIPVLWFLTLLAATVTPTLKTLFGVLLAWVILNIVVPASVGPRLVAALILLPQMVIVILIVLALRGRPNLSGHASVSLG
jgi:ABC-type sulfate transport system permease component